MAIKDNKSDTEVIVLIHTELAGNLDLDTDSFDTADYANGVTIVPTFGSGFGTGMTVTLTIEEGDTEGGSFTPLNNNHTKETVINQHWN